MRTAAGAVAADSSLGLSSKEEGSSSELQIKLCKYIPYGEISPFVLQIISACLSFSLL